MKEKIKELLSKDINSEKELALDILFLKYQMVSNKEKVDMVDTMSYLCIDTCYKEEIEKLEKYYSISIDKSNPFTHEVINSLESDSLIDICPYDNNKGNVKITVPYGIDYLRSIYNVETKNNNKNIKL